MIGGSKDPTATLSFCRLISVIHQCPTVWALATSSYLWGFTSRPVVWTLIARSDERRELRYCAFGNRICVCVWRFGAATALFPSSLLNQLLSWVTFGNPHDRHSGRSTTSNKSRPAFFEFVPNSQSNSFMDHQRFLSFYLSLNDVSLKLK